jgi:hypothetical protein
MRELMTVVIGLRLKSIWRSSRARTPGIAADPD